MGHKQPLSNAQVLKLEGSGGVSPGKFWALESLRLNLLESETNYLIPDSRVRIGE